MVHLGTWRQERGRYLVISNLVAAATVVAYAVSYRELDALFTSFVTGPVVIVAWVVLVLLIVYWLNMLRNKHFRLEAFVLIVLSAAAVSLVLLSPWEEQQILSGFQQERRDRAITRIQMSSEWSPEYRATVVLPPKESDLSYGYGEVDLVRIHGQTYALFYFWRGIGSYSGYVFVPPDGSIEEYAQHEQAEDMLTLGARWHFVHGD